MTRLDAHQHFWQYDPVRDAWITEAMATIRRDFLPADLEPVLAANGIDACIAVQADQSLDETRFLLRLAREHEFIRGVVGWVDLRAHDLESKLEHLAADAPLVGIRHIAQAEPDDFLQRPDVIAGIRAVGRRNLAYDILVFERQLPAAIALVSALADQRFVLDHLAKPRIREGVLEPWRDRIRELARRPNVWCKLSGLVTEADWSRWQPGELAPYLDVVLDAFGADRVMFGSDWPVCLVAAPYQGVVRIIEDWAAAMSAPERDALFGGNAARAYRIRARH